MPTWSLVPNRSAIPREVLAGSVVGLGIVPDNAMARAFRDHAGRVNQAVAAASGRAILVAAGLPLALKGAVVTG